MTSTLTIESKPTKEGKTRRFSATLLGYLTANTLWEGGFADTKAIRPVALWAAGSESGLRPFLANLKSGRKAIIDTGNRWSRNKNQIEILRSAGYDYVWQKLSDSNTAVVCIYLHDLFATDPGLIDSSTCAFISAPPQWWLDRQLMLLDAQPSLWQPVLHHARRLRLLDDAESPIGAPVFTEDELKLATALAYHFCTSLDRRTRRPLINSLAFYMQVYLGLLAERAACHPENAGWGWARQGRLFSASGVARVGVPYPAQMRASQSALDEFLVRQARIYREYGGHHG